MKRLFFTSGLMVWLLISCGETDPKPDFATAATVEAVNEYALISQIFQDVGNQSGDGVLYAENSNAAKAIAKSINNGALITVEPADFSTFPKTTTIDFKSGVKGKDGITRKGIVTIVSTNWYREADSEHTTTFQNFYHEDYKVEGTHVAKNMGKNKDDFLKFNVRIENGRITTQEGASISYIQDSYRTWVSGFDTPLNVWDDQYLLDGTQSGTSSKGVNYELSIKESLHFFLLPREVKSGILMLNIGKIKDIELNYTNSTLTIFGVSYPFKE